MESPTSVENRHDSFIACIDQGTSSSRVIILSLSTGQIAAMHQIKTTLLRPENGWIEMDADQIYDEVLACLKACADQMRKDGLRVEDVKGLGITNQRETTVLWDKQNGRPLAPAIVWSDSRTMELVELYTRKTPSCDPNTFQHKTGLPLHSYFSALKIRWLLDNNHEVAEAAQQDRLAFGTIDSWLVARFTLNKLHVTDVTNASRTNLFNINQMAWDEELCSFFGINPCILPRVVSCAEQVGVITDPSCAFCNVPLSALIGDQHASLLAQTWNPGKIASDATAGGVKVTLGTGAFILANVGLRPCYSSHGLLTTLAYQLGPDEPVYYALEGAVANAGSTIDWLRYKLNLLPHDQANLDAMLSDTTVVNGATKSHSSSLLDACYLVPAFTGLFCPWWQEQARGIVCGLTGDVNASDLMLAGIRSVAYQCFDVLSVARMASSSSGEENRLGSVDCIHIDGGLARLDVMSQAMADIIGCQITRYNHCEWMTALGAGIAGALGLHLDPSNLLKLRLYPSATSSQQQPPRLEFHPCLDQSRRAEALAGWHCAVGRSLNWTSEVADAIERDESSSNQVPTSLLHLLDTVKQQKSDHHQPGNCRSQCSIASKAITTVGVLVLGVGLGYLLRLTSSSMPSSCK